MTKLESQHMRLTVSIIKALVKSDDITYEIKEDLVKSLDIFEEELNKQ